MMILKNLFLDLLFPRQCLGCHVDSTWLCHECWLHIKLKSDQSDNTSNFKNLNGVIIATDYHDKLVANILQSFKYNFVNQLGLDLGNLLVKCLSARINQGKVINFDLVVAVPLAKKRELWRGFNQADILATVVSQKFDWSLGKNLIYRKYHTRPQVGLRAQERLKNIKGIFAIKNGDSLVNKSILLIDDMITTGATIEECAKVLKSAGAKEVWGLVIAEG
ncbi:MAG: hypothetical protein CMI53_02135 [Parcubacteria group bacterium]|nr:hypothetical protein [Parcubacteria group bacterium]|tara:strand:+ start:1539 stop:2198 length:660 start_codon:yes stop_codon:yes gene_type:complete